MFSILIAKPLELFNADIKRVNPKSAAVALYDDIYFWVPRHDVARASAVLVRLFRSIGLEFNIPKTKFYYPNGVPSDLPAEYRPFIVQSLPCLGCTVSYVRSHS